VVIEYNYYNKIFVLSPFPIEEVQKSNFGGARLIREQIIYLRKAGARTYFVDLSNFRSILSSIYKICSLIRSKNMKKSPFKIFKVEKIRWLFNLFLALIIDFAGKIDLFLKIQLKRELDKERMLVIHNYPYGTSAILDLKEATKMIYEHNIEWIFFEDKLQSRFFQPFVKLLKLIELTNLRKTDWVLCVNKKDLSTLVVEGIAPHKIQIFIPLFNEEKSISAPQALGNLAEILKGKRVIGFVGSYFEPNIVAVKNILKIARKVPENFVFLAIGSVSKAFETISPPSNVIFLGYVNNLDQYLALCDAFINPKTTSHTGIEIKMFDYLKHDKPIIATKIGGSGFEHLKNKNIIICDLELFPSKLIEIFCKEGDVNEDCTE